MPRIRDLGCHMITSRYTPAELMRNAQRLDTLGYDHLKVGDHTLSTSPASPYPNSQVVLAMIGAHTKRAKLSTAVTDPLRRHPAEIAHWVATLDQFTSGRAALGIGAGEEMNLTPFGIQCDKPWTRLKEALEVIKKLWEATPTRRADYTGEFFSLSGAYLQTLPYQKPRPKIYIGAIGKRTRELAGEQADGWLPMATETPESLKEKFQAIRAGASKAGRDISGFDVQAQVYTDVSEDADRAYGSVEATAKGGLIFERSILKQKTGLDVPEDLSVQKIDVTSKAAMDRITEFAAMIPRKVVEEVTVTGSPDQCISKIEKLVQAGATSVIICNLSPDQDRVFEVYGKEIFPYLRERYGVE
ncbi:MAG: LLM class flavin-dependent oxidoreductase [Thaumarchaeota archaeon]|nr:LLM class flavin-dependent oxidoreductase [Nitrososphaerota archaeon]